VIPTVNRVELLRRALYSALRQRDRFDDYEIVVLDNYSDDGTWDYLQSIGNPRIKVFRNPDRLPPASNWNKAARLSSGEFLYMLQDDDVASPNMLATVSRSISRHEGVDLICFGTCLMDEDEQNHRIFGQPESETFLPAPEAVMRFARGWDSSIAQIVFSRAAFDLHGGFDEAHPFTSDAETVLIWMIYSNVVLVPNTLVMRRIWPDQVMAKISHTPEWRKAMSNLADTVIGAATDSRRLDLTQLEDLRLALLRNFVHPSEMPREPGEYLRLALPERYGRTS